jgi:hypothetical protein
LQILAGRVALVAELPVLNIERILKQWKRQKVAIKMEKKEEAKGPESI